MSSGQNFNNKIAAGVSTRMEKEQFKVEVEKKSTSSTVKTALLLLHDLRGLINILPTIIQVSEKFLPYAVCSLSYWFSSG